MPVVGLAVPVPFQHVQDVDDHAPVVAVIAGHAPSPILRPAAAGGWWWRRRCRGRAASRARGGSRGCRARRRPGPLRRTSFRRWPVAAASDSEVLAIYAHRSDVPRDAWAQLFKTAERDIGVLVYSGLFLAEDAAAQKILADGAGAGVRVRILLGDPDSPQVAERGASEGVGDAMAAKIRNALVLYRALRGAGGVEFRFHQTILYNSIYRSDDQLLVNTHVYGVTAALAPVWHLRRLAGGQIAATYLESFEQVWDTAVPLPG